MSIIPSLEREGGHIAVLFLLVIICIVLSYAIPENVLVTKCGDLSLGALLLAMKGNGNGKSKPDDSAPMAITKTPP